MTAATAGVRDSSGKADPRWFAPGALFLVTAVLAAVSLFVSWWTVQYTIPTSSGMDSGTMYFLPGGSAHVVVNGVSSWVTYSVLDPGDFTGTLYGTIQGAVIIIAIVAAAAGVLTVYLGFSRSSRLPITAAILALGIIAVIGLTLTEGLFPIAEPQSSPPTFCGIGSGGNTPCASFYGSASGGGGFGSWGPDWGWYLVGTALVTLVGALVLFAWTQRGAWATSASGSTSEAVSDRAENELWDAEVSSAP